MGEISLCSKAVLARNIYHGVCVCRRSVELQDATVTTETHTHTQHGLVSDASNHLQLDYRRQVTLHSPGMTSRSQEDSNINAKSKMASPVTTLEGLLGEKTGGKC